MTGTNVEPELSYGLQHLQQLIHRLETTLVDSHRHRELIARLQHEADMARRLFDNAHEEANGSRQARL
jgi:hypothetical protein